MSVVLGRTPALAKLVEIHNSDVTSFLRCRRQWHWSSTLAGHRGLTTAEESPAPLWFGTGFHYAMEDWYGYRRFTHPGDALTAYADATGPRPGKEDTRPTEWESLVELGVAMLDYYLETWLESREEYPTLWVDGIPQVEVDFTVAIPGSKACFGGTFDRVVVDPDDDLWILDYKTAKQITSAKWETDSQPTNYIWAGEQLYGRPVAGIIMQQFLKAVPSGPKRLKDGTFSLDARQRTSYPLYYKTLYGVHGEIPERYWAYIDQLARGEDEHRDAYVRRDLITRSRAFIEAQPWKLRTVARDMLDPKLPLYPNPMPQCANLCAFRTPCLALDDDQDWEYLLEANYKHRSEDKSWRERIDYATTRGESSGPLILVDEEDDDAV